MTKNDIQLLSFQVISNSGDALDCFKQSVEHAKNKEYDLSIKKYEEGKEFLKKAHQIQTDLIHEEVIGNEISFSIILIHAQDHLTSAEMYQNFAEELIDLYKMVNTK